MHSCLLSSSCGQRSAPWAPTQAEGGQSCGGPGLVPSSNSCSTQGAAIGVMLEMGNQQVRTKLLPRLGATCVLKLK